VRLTPVCSHSIGQLLEDARHSAPLMRRARRRESRPRPRRPSGSRDVPSGDNAHRALLSGNATCDSREAGSDRQLDDPRLDTAIRDLDLRHRDR
jgi:hypothetical protein